MLGIIIAVEPACAHRAPHTEKTMASDSKTPPGGNPRSGEPAQPAQDRQATSKQQTANDTPRDPRGAP
ncbi:MAG TPA: hypothetical protein VIT92_11490, partial [Burkholderiaceae bacterium]